MESNFFTILCWSLPYSNMNQPQVYVCPLPLESPSHLPPYPTPLWIPPGSHPGFHRTPDLSSLNHTENFHWLSNFANLDGNVYILMLFPQFIPSPFHHVHEFFNLLVIPTRKGAISPKILNSSSLEWRKFRQVYRKGRQW